MTELDVTELLDRAAATVNPALTEPGPRLAERGRRAERRRRVWAAASLLAVVVAGVGVAVPRVVQGRTASVARTGDLRDGTQVAFGTLRLALPGRWGVRIGQDVDLCSARSQTIVTGWVHKYADCDLPTGLVLVAAEPLRVGGGDWPPNQVRRDDGSTVTWQQMWISGNLPVSRVDGYLVTIPDGRQVFVVGIAATSIRDDVATGLSW